MSPCVNVIGKPTMPTSRCNVYAIKIQQLEEFGSSQDIQSNNGKSLNNQ